TIFEPEEINARVASFEKAAVDCFGKGVFSAFAEVGVYLLLTNAGVPIYPGGSSNVYAGQTVRNFVVRFAEHVGGKTFSFTKSFGIADEFLTPQRLRTIEQLLMDAFGGKAELANRINASRELFCQ